ncbi:UNVERIFIED_CONTAM: hypothetical protein Sradi_2010400 [Sesamum radiatum]|uniref:Reverse transcriptase n=1 Tax=Sesamum radiatum TaxID=300843 RepID=A0AAW2TJF1_SESRA
MQEAESRGRLTGVMVKDQAPSISHLLFVDDTLVFCEARETQLEEIQRILYSYERSSGQVINFRSLVWLSDSRKAQLMYA